MKKALITLLTLCMVFCFFACGSKTASTFEIAMITDIGTIDDKSFNQGTWEGVEAYAKANDVTYKYYQPTEDSTDARLEQIDLAIKNGAKVIVTPGYLFEEAIFIAQDKYPDVDFVLIDGNPHNADYSTYKTADNAVGITFAEQQAGYLAGYAVVKDGYTKLGFMGGVAVPAVIRYGYGFVEGANAAAKEFGIKGVTINYNYTGGFTATPAINTAAAAWYSAGTQVIFSCGGGIFASISAAAESAKTKVIGVDVDQSSQSTSVITSAMKGLGVAVNDELTAYYAGTFPGGKNIVLGAAEDAVGLPMDTSIFTKFVKADYDKVFAEIKAGTIKISVDTDAKDVTKLNVPNITVKLVK